MFCAETLLMKNSLLQTKQSEKLIYWGFVLFLLGLIVGLIIPVLANPRMGLSSHIEGVLNGMFLIILGLVWNKIQLNNRWLNITWWLAIYGTFANWLSMLVAAVFNAGKMLTVAANGKEGHPVAEATVSFLLITLTIAMLIICVTVLIGLKRNMKQ